MNIIKSKNAKKQWESPEARERITAGIRKAGKDPALRELRRQKALGRWKNPEFRAKMIIAQSGSNNANWNPYRSQILHRKGKGFLKSQVKRLLKKNCGWCGTAGRLQLDHIIAICAGGHSEDSNAQTLCVKCNNVKRVTIDMPLMEKRRENGEHLRDGDNTVPSWVLKSLEGVETRGRVVRRLGTRYLRIEVACSTCNSKTLKQPNQLRRAKEEIYCSHDCRRVGLNGQGSNTPTSALAER